MMQIRRRWGFFAGIAFFLLGCSYLAYVGRACGLMIAFRAYLTRSFWQPMYCSMNALAPEVKKKAGKPVPYAGISETKAPPVLDQLRKAYLPLSFPDSQTPVSDPTAAIRQALAPGALTGTDLEEARLID